MASSDQLSDETLLLIFNLNARQYLRPIHDTLKTTLATSHVCKRWRDITLKHPILWSNSFDISKPLSFLRNVIHPRIKGHKVDALVIPSIVPLLMQDLKLRGEIEISSLTGIAIISTLFNFDIKLNQFSSRLLHILKLLPDTEKVFLKIPYHGWLQLEMFFEFSIAHLDTLVLQRDEVDIHSDFKTSTVNTLSYVLGKATSVWKMRTLRLKGCCVELNSTALSGMENLYLTQIPLCVAFTSNTLLDVLKAMPKLQRVRLIDTMMAIRYPNLGFEKFEPLEKPIDLPHLVEFVIWGQVGPVGEVASSLTFPTECALSIHGKGVTSHQGTNSPINPMLHQLRTAFKRKQPPSPTHWNTLVLQMHPQMCRLRVWQQAFPVELDSLLEDATTSRPVKAPEGLELSFFWNQALLSPTPLSAEPRIDSSAILRQVASNLPKYCKGIFALHLDYDLSSLILPSAHESLMFGFLSHFPKVQILDKVNLNTAEFLMPYFKFPYDGETVKDPLKDLHTICFVSVDFTKAYSWPVAEEAPRPVELRQILLDYVERRVKNGKLEPIKEIIFRRCKGFTPTDARALFSFGVTPAFYI